MASHYEGHEACLCPACTGQLNFEGDVRYPYAAPSAYTDSQVISQIDSNSTWSGSTISYGFLTSSPSWDIGYEGDGFSPFNATQAAAARLTMSLWDDLITPSFSEASSNQHLANIKFGNTTTNISFAHAYFPGSSPWAGEVWLNAQTYTYLQSPDAFSVGSISYAHMALLHEVGHALGLSHPGNYNGGSPTYDNDAQYAQDTHQWTVMSYFSSSNTGADWNGGSGWGYAQTPMVHDIMTIQSMYDAETTTRTGDTTYGFNSNAGNTLFDFSVNASPILTIYDAGGTDTLDLSGFSNRAIIDLAPGTYSSAGGTTSTMTYNIGVAHNTWIENAVGGAGSDTIYGNALDNTLWGNAGSDQLYGLDGNDQIYGGSGVDWAHYSDVFASYTIFSLSNALYFFDAYGDTVWNDVEWFSFSDINYSYQQIVDLIPQHVGTEIESNGSYNLIQIENVYVVENAVGEQVPVTDAGRPVGSATHPSWQATHVESDGGGGYSLLWQSASGEYEVWTLNESGAVQNKEILASSKLGGYEALFLSDLNNDGSIGYVSTSIENNGAYELLSGTSGTYLIKDSGGNEITASYGGNPVGPDSFADWQALQVEADGNGGFALLWQHSSGSNGVWTLDASGAYVGHETVSVSGLIDFETVFQSDLNNDGSIGHVSTSIESNGAYELLSSTSGAYLIKDSGGDEITASYLGDPVGPDSFAGWQASQVEADGNGGFALLWQHSSGSNIVWTLDASGAHVGHETVSASGLVDFETVFLSDLNNDGSIGHVSTSIENNGAYELLSSTSGTYLIKDSGGDEITASYLGNPVGPDSFAGWQASQVEADGNGGFALLWQHSSGSNIVWTLDASGACVGHETVSASGLIDFETVFQSDLNNDDSIGHVSTSIESNGAYELLSSTSGAYLIKDSGGDEVAASYLGDPVGPDSFAGWQASQVEADGNGGFALLWQHSSGSNGVWTLDASRAYVGYEAVSAEQLSDWESVFAADFDGDGNVV